MKRRRARALALEVLYEIDLTGHSPEEAWQGARARASGLDDEGGAYAWRLVSGVTAHRAELDAEIAARARDWTLERMAAVDRNVLRIGLYELLYVPEVPESVLANEAVELAKAYGTEDSPRFVNGILGAAIRDGLRRSRTGA